MAYHGPAVCDKTGLNTGHPSVGDIVGSIVVRFQEREKCTNGKEISVLVKNRHLDNEVADESSKRF
jgi:hypothetical protein